jgi:hypothetical protein
VPADAHQRLGEDRPPRARVDDGLAGDEHSPLVQRGHDLVREAAIVLAALLASTIGRVGDEGARRGRLRVGQRLVGVLHGLHGGLAVAGQQDATRAHLHRHGAGRRLDRRVADHVDEALGGHAKLAV